jgi:heme A synthase
MKIVILIILAMIIASLFLALFTLVKDKGQTNRTVRALTMRVALSVGLIVLLLVSYKAGIIKPNQSPYMYINESQLQAPK